MSNFDNGDRGGRNYRSGKGRQRHRRHAQDEDEGKGGGRQGHGDFDRRGGRAEGTEHGEKGESSRSNRQRRENQSSGGAASGCVGNRNEQMWRNSNNPQLPHAEEYTQVQTVPPPPPPLVPGRDGRGACATYSQGCPYPQQPQPFLREARHPNERTPAHAMHRMNPGSTQLQPCSQMPQLTMPHVNQTNQQMQPFLATPSPVPVGTSDEVAMGYAYSRDDIVPHIREACKASDVSKAIGFLRNIEDEKRQVALPLVLEDFKCILNAASNPAEDQVKVSPIDVSEIAYQLAKLQTPAGSPQVTQNIDDLLKSVSEIAKHHAPELTPHAISRLVWGFATLAQRNDSLMSVVAAEVVRKIDSFQHQELANTAWAFAKVGLWNDTLAQRLAGQCVDKMDTFTTESLSNVAWAMAQWGSKQETLLQKMADALCSKRDTLTPVSMSKIAWAFSTLSYKSVNLMSLIAAESTRQMSQFSMKELANLAWAFANLRLQNEKLYDAMADQLSTRRDDRMQPSEVANIAWAFAKNFRTKEGIKEGHIMRRLADEALPQIGSFKAAEITMLTWAFAVSSVPHPDLMREIGVKVAKRCEKFAAAQLVHVVWAFGALSMRQKDLCDAVATSCRRDMKLFTANGLAQIIWGFSMAQYRDTAFMHDAEPVIIEGISSLKPLALYRVVCSYDDLAVHSSKLKEAILDEALKKQEEFSLKGLSRLLECYTTCAKPASQEALEKVLDKRLGTVATFLGDALRPETKDTEKQRLLEQLESMGIRELRAPGMKSVLAKLDIGMPGWTFVSECLKKAPHWRPRNWVRAQIQLHGLDEAGSTESFEHAFGYESR
ncbi:unnamed protein product, partial [Effrenium voratum]